MILEWDEELTEKVKERAEDLGVDKIGVADADRADGAPMFFASPYSMLEDAESILSLCIKYPKGTFKQLDDFYVTLPTFANLRKTLLQELNAAAIGLSRLLGENGYNSVPLGPNIPVDERRWIKCMLSHRYIGQIAGVGEIGANNFLVTPEWGPRIELASVITNAPLVVDGPELVGEIYDEKCRDCYKCVDACPTDALNREKEPPYNFDLNKCLWGIQGWRHLSGIDIPPQDWRDAKPTPSRVISKYEKKYPKIGDYREWQDRLGGFPYCIVCRAVCPVGKE